MTPCLQKQISKHYRIWERIRNHGKVKTGFIKNADGGETFYKCNDCKQYFNVDFMITRIYCSGHGTKSLRVCFDCADIK